MSKDQLILSIQWVIDREVVVCKLFNRVSHRTGIRMFFLSISKLGDGSAWYVLILFLPLIYRQNGFSTSWLMVKVGLVNLMLYKVIKHFVGRPRPCAMNLGINLGTAPLDQYSFPSGHTMHAVGFSMVAIAHHPDLAWVLVPFTTLIAMSRIVLGLHYPTDVIAGGLIGGGVVSVMIPS
jgi:undecaprenyl-diphosphatase